MVFVPDCGLNMGDQVNVTNGVEARSHSQDSCSFLKKGSTVNFPVWANEPVSQNRQLIV
jgi:hypothetical protein